MISMLILSHNFEIARGVRHLAMEMNNNASIYAVGGAKDQSNGSDYDTTKEKLHEALSKGEVIVFFDLGSTLMTIQMIYDELTEEEQKRVFITDAALVEGAIVTAVYLGTEMSVDQILKELKEVSINKL